MATGNGQVQEITEANMDAQVLRSTLPVLLDFTAEWCWTCKVNERTALANSEVQKRLAELDVQVREAAKVLSDERRLVIERLTADVSARLRNLGMPEGRLAVDHSVAADLEAFTARGADRAEFLLASNPGREPLPLAKVASGGEISRTMLALKAEAALEDGARTMVFDEIDVGIGGQTSARVGQALLDLALRPPHAQVLCVTHSPQIAALAHQQIAVRKVSHNGGVRILAETVRGEPRRAELARMLGGDADDAAVFEHAEVLAREGAKARERHP